VTAMAELTATTARRLAPELRPLVEPGSLEPRIVHFGLGAFHRAHQAVYTEACAARTGEPWGIAVVAPRHGFWTPNGRHRLAAMRRLGAKSISALVVADREVAWQILALNTEKAHNLKERALEVIRIYRGLVDEDSSRLESQFAFYLEEPALVTLGICYERVPRFGGGVYHPILRRTETFKDEPLRTELKNHEKRAEMVLDLEEKVAGVVKKLKERGLVSPYLRSFVVARINPLRWIKGEPPSLEEVLKTMRERVGRFKIETIRPQDLAGAGGPLDEEA